MVDDRLYDFAIEQADRADWRVTAEWCARHPDLAVTLIGFTAMRQVDMNRTEQPPLTANERVLVEMAMKRFRDSSRVHRPPSQPLD